ncbi:MAG TPA: PAS domain-containing sensor histidine kinase [Mucilaginibacter sp.]
MLKKDGTQKRVKQRQVLPRPVNENHNDTAHTTPQKLEEVQKELIAFFDAMDDVFFSVDMINLRVTQISKSCEKLYGYQAADFLADHLFWFGLIHPDDKHIVENENNILRLGGQINNTYRIIRKDKAIRWVESKIVPGLDETGKLVRVDGITRDITDRREAEENHRRSEYRYRQIVETAQEGIWTIDENEKTNFVNKKICDILEYSPQEMMGKKLYDFIDKEGKAYAIQCIERRRQGVKENLDFRYVTKSGKNVWANISTNPIFDETGKYRGALAMLIDITQRKLNEEALKKSEANLRTIFENTDSAYVLFSSEMKIISFNALAQKFSEEQNNIQLKINASIKHYFTPERWVFIKKTLNKIKRESIVNYEISLPNADGSAKWFDVRWLIVKNSDNKNCGFILTHNDITKEKLIALEREKITADLIKHNSDLEQFTYIISHNLRAPVANIVGLSNMLKEDDLEQAEKQEMLDRISIAIGNIETVITDLNMILQVRKPLNEKNEMVSFNDLIEAIKTSIHDTTESDRVQFKCTFKEADSIFTIRSYLYSIFYNLISNSIKYRKLNVAPVITIKSRKLNDKIELSFKDNGKGIDLHKNSQMLFGLYKRFDTSVEGKGMGLFMVKTQVEALGGTIKVKSKPGQGSNFIITLPI